MLYIIPVSPVRKLKQGKVKQLAQSLPVTGMAVWRQIPCPHWGYVCLMSWALRRVPGHISPKVMLIFFGIIWFSLYLLSVLPQLTYK